MVAAVSRATGVSERELQAQQDSLRLRFGELCAINAIARGDSGKVQGIAPLKSKGKTWTQLANIQRRKYRDSRPDGAQRQRNDSESILYKYRGARQGRPAEVEKHRV